MLLAVSFQKRMIKQMCKTLLLALSVLTLQSVMIASTGQFASRRSAPTTSRAAAQPGGKPGPLAYAITVNQFGVLDIGSGRFHLIADLPNAVVGSQVQCIARDAQGKIYVVDANNNLVRIKPGNGNTKVIGSTGVTTPGPVGPRLVDVCASVNGELFLMDYSNNLYSVNPNTGAATLIGYTGIPSIISPIYASSLAGDCESLFFTIGEKDIRPPTLYRIDPRTAVATLVGLVGGIPRGIAGSGFIDGTLYGFSLDFRFFGGTEGPHAFAIDTSTGGATLVSDLNIPGMRLVGGAVRFAGAQAGRCKAE
jgi:hypothetical protein